MESASAGVESASAGEEARLSIVSFGPSVVYGRRG